MASVEDPRHPPAYNDDVIDDDDDVDIDDDDDSTSSSNLPPTAHPLQPPPPPPCNPSIAGEVTIAVAGVSSCDSPSLHPDPKRQRITNEFTAPPPPAAALTVVPEKKPAAVFDDSRKLFQRLWTDEDEIELLQGFLEYTTQRGLNNSSSQHHHHDTTAFYDQIKSKLQLDFNKNQLVEKLRRLKKKYRNVMSKMGSGKEFVFKSAHDQTTFEISRKIWSNGGFAVRGGADVIAGGSVGFSAMPEDGGLDDEDAQLNLNANSFIDRSPNFNLNSNPNGIHVKTPRSRKRSRVATGAVKAEEKHGFIQTGSSNVPMSVPMPTPMPMPTTNPAPIEAQPVAAAAATATPTLASIPSLIEETVKSCISPVFKELLNNVTNMNGSRGIGFGGMAWSPIPLGFGGGVMTTEMMADEKWRKQQILELEVYLRRLELVQDQIKAQLEELRSMGSYS